MLQNQVSLGFANIALRAVSSYSITSYTLNNVLLLSKASPAPRRNVYGPTGNLNPATSLSFFSCV